MLYRLVRDDHQNEEKKKNTAADALQRPKETHFATVLAGMPDPVGVREMYCVKAPAREECRMCLKALETARYKCECMLVETTARPGSTTSMNVA